VDDTEDRRGPTDAQCERQHDGRREPRTASKAASAKTDITQHVSEDLPGATVSDGFSRHIGRSHPKVGLTARRSGRLSRTLLLLQFACEVVAQLFIEFGCNA
jgi:hypothetical protein